MSTLSNTISHCSVRTGSTLPDISQNWDQDSWSNFSTSDFVHCLENTSTKFIDCTPPQKQALLPPHLKNKLPTPHFRKISAPTNSPAIVAETTSSSDILGEHTSPKFIDCTPPQKQAFLPSREKTKLPTPHYRKMSAPTNSPAIIAETTSLSDITDNTSPKFLDFASPSQLPPRQKQTVPAPRYRKMSAPTTSKPEAAMLIPLPPNRKHGNATKSSQQPSSNAVPDVINNEHSLVPVRSAPPVPIFTPPQQLSPPPTSTERNNDYLEPTSPEPIQERAHNQTQGSRRTQHSTSESSNSVYRRRPHFIIRRRNLIFISGFSLLLSLLSLCMLVFLVRKPFSYDWQKRTFREGKFSACIKCVYLMQYTTDNNADLRSLYNVNRDGEMFCCARKSEQISNLMKLILKQQDYVPKPQIAASQDVIPHAHKKLGFASEKTFAVPPDHFIMKVVIDNDSNFCNQTVIVSDYSLRIEVSGWYYVYSNIYYQTNCSRDISYKTFEHTVSLVSPTRPTKSGSLIGTEYTCCTDCNQSDQKSSFAGGVFELFQDDQILASVTNMKVVDFFNEQPYLGVAMIGELIS